MIATLDSATHSLPPLTIAMVGVEPVQPIARQQPQRKERDLQQEAARNFAAARQRDRDVPLGDRDTAGEQAGPQVAGGQPRRAIDAGFYRAPFSPFLAQQIAQEQLPEHQPPSRQMLERSHQAYRTSAGDQSTLLGPVTPRQLTV